MNMELLIIPTVRESDGLALSSRNAYLTSVQREQALALSRALRAADLSWRQGIHDADLIRGVIAEQFRASPAVTMDYIAVVDPVKLAPVSTVAHGTIVAVAGRVGSTRLLDNHILGMEFR